MLEMTSAYAAVAAGAYPVKAWAVTGLNAVDEKAAPPWNAGRWGLGERPYMLRLLRGTVERGSGRRAKLPIRAYGKTGTSQSYRDAWFVGFAGNLVVGVWVGNDNSRPMKGVTGGSLPAEIWGTFMRQAIQQPGFRQGGRVAAFEAKPRKRNVRFVKAGFSPNRDARKVKKKKNKKRRNRNKRKKRTKKR